METLHVFCMTARVNISRNFLLTGRKGKERLRGRGIEKASEVQKEITLTFFFIYCYMSIDLGRIDVAVWYMMATMLLPSTREAQMNLHRSLSLLALGPQAEAGDSPGSMVREPKTSCNGSTTSHCTDKDCSSMRHTALGSTAVPPVPQFRGTSHSHGIQYWSQQECLGTSAYLESQCPLGQDWHLLPALATASVPIS